MAKKSGSKSIKPSTKKRSSPWMNILLSLSLVPTVLGILLIGAWLLDMNILENQSEVTVGLFFILVGFAASNAFQKRYRLAIGWGLLAVADLILLIWVSLWTQGFALIVGLIGVVFLGIEFYKQYQQNKGEKANKKP